MVRRGRVIPDGATIPPFTRWGNKGAPMHTYGTPELSGDVYLTSTHRAH
jgi:hypothetical protein